MRLFLLFLLLLGLASSFGTKHEAVELQEGRDIIGDFGKRIQQFLDFLCSRCQEIITLINKEIDSEGLLEYVEQFCDSAFPANSLRDVCHNVTKGILKEVYAFLKRIEPDPQICTHLRLCDACSPPNSTRREIPLFRDDSSRSFVNSLLVRLAPFADVFSSSPQQPAVDNEIKP